eukprot:TRINITY_DN67030_c7_g2_i1.p1 TRINITY_DN67030_c7_g2~~TRINITY_DN67030_c7_g2_i1.p1  ORF type:complete len:1309 (-),score=194.70 TRINITY_DN67030_c7_g2_i1:571-4497(-)
MSGAAAERTKLREQIQKNGGVMCSLPYLAAGKNVPLEVQVKEEAMKKQLLGWKEFERLDEQAAANAAKTPEALMEREQNRRQRLELLSQTEMNIFDILFLKELQMLEVPDPATVVKRVVSPTNTAQFEEETRRQRLETSQEDDWNDLQSSFLQFEDLSGALQTVNKTAHTAIHNNVAKGSPPLHTPKPPLPRTLDPISPSQKPPPSGRFMQSSNPAKQGIGYLQHILQRTVEGISGMSIDERWGKVARHVEAYPQAADLATISSLYDRLLQLTIKHTAYLPQPSEKRMFYCCALLDLLLQAIIRFQPLLRSFSTSLRNELYTGIFMKKVEFDTTRTFDPTKVDLSILDKHSAKFSVGTWHNYAKDFEKDNNRLKRVTTEATQSAKGFQHELERVKASNNSDTQVLLREIQLLRAHSGASSDKMKNLEDENKKMARLNSRLQELQQKLAGENDEVQQWRKMVEGQFGAIEGKLSQVQEREEQYLIELSQERARTREAERKLADAPSQEEVYLMKEQVRLVEDSNRRLQEELRHEREKAKQRELVWHKEMENQRQRIREIEKAADDQRDADRIKARHEHESMRQQMLAELARERKRLEHQRTRTEEEMDKERRDRLRIIADFEREKQRLEQDREATKQELQREHDRRAEMEHRTEQLEQWEKQLQADKAVYERAIQDARAHEKELTEKVIKFQRQCQEAETRHLQVLQEVQLKAASERGEQQGLLAQERERQREREQQMKQELRAAELEVHRLERVETELQATREQLDELKQQKTDIENRLQVAYEAQRQLEDAQAKAASAEDKMKAMTVEVGEMRVQTKQAVDECAQWREYSSGLAAITNKVMKAVEGPQYLRQLRNHCLQILNKPPSYNLLLQWANTLIEKHEEKLANKLRNFSGGSATLNHYIILLSVLSPAHLATEQVKASLGAKDSQKAAQIVKLLNAMGIPSFISEDELLHEPTEPQHVLMLSALFNRFADGSITVFHKFTKTYQMDAGLNYDQTTAIDQWTDRSDRILGDVANWRVFGERLNWEAELFTLGEWKTGQPPIPRTPEDFINVGEEQRNRGESQKALELFNHAIEMEPKLAAAYYKRAVLYQYNIQDYNAAMQDYTRAIQLNSKFADAFKDRADLKQYHYQNYHSAVEDYDRAITFGKQDGDTYNNRGECMKRHNEHQSAYDDFEKALAANPNHETAQKNRDDIAPLVASNQRVKFDRELKDIAASMPPPQFAQKKANLSNETDDTLDKISQLLKQYKLIRLKVVGTTAMQQRVPLARRRAQTCVDYLLRNGIDPKRVEGEGRHGNAQAILWETLT